MKYKYWTLYALSLVLITQEKSYGMMQAESQTPPSEVKNPPMKPKITKKPVRIYESSEPIKIDKEGLPYVGRPIDEVMQTKDDSKLKESNGLQTQEIQHIY